MKVIFHVDQIERWELTVKNVNNFLNEVPDATIEVLANAEAVEYYTDADKVSELEKLNAKFLVCGNALKAHDIEQERIADFIEVVPAGVVELARKQDAGYAYIRP